MKFHPLSIKISLCCGLLAAGLLVVQPKLYSQQVATTTTYPIFASGEYSRYKNPDDLKVEGATNPADFKEEVYGKSFSVLAEGLPAGIYTIEIEVAETYHKTPGQRVMRVTSGDVVLADNFDAFTAGGGYAKAAKITGKVQHAADAIGGPLTIKFETIADNAKFNAIRILNADGQVVAFMRASETVEKADVEASKIPQVTGPVIYTNPDKPFDDRVDDLIRRMSLLEKVGQLMNKAPAITRLNVPAYDYWSEALHGVARNGNATVFPQAIGMAATWDAPLVHRIGEVVSTEGRAKYYEAIRQDKHGENQGLTFWAPNINIFRDPRWGRGHETYGEDPYLTARTAVSYITGMQGDNPKYFKTIACAKHFAVHSGPEPGRGGFDVQPAQRDLYETYLPQFQAAVQEAKVGSVMAAYNSIDGVPASANHWLLTDLLRKQWGFKGHVVSDCGAVGNISGAHHYTTTSVEGSAKAIKAGLDLECGTTFRVLTKSVAQGFVTEKELDGALHNVLKARFQLGLFDPPARVPYSNVPMTEVESPAHLELARQSVRESIVLLKNNGVLPLDKSKLKKIALIGPNANDNGVMNGNYNGDPSKPVNIFNGIQNKVGAGVTVEWKRGCSRVVHPGDSAERDARDFQEAVDLAKSSDVVIFVGGLDAGLEGEEGAHFELPGFNSGDRTRIELPEVQTNLLKALYATGKPVIFVNMAGSSVGMIWEAANLPAIVQSWYPGGEGGVGVADVLFGDYNPGGRLPVTFYEKTSDLPEYHDYSMKNRTYRYFNGKVLFPFGHGLSYTKFEYQNPKASKTKLSAKDTIKLSVPVKNTGQRDGDEVVQVYLKHKNSSVSQPIRSLVAYKRVPIAKGATINTDFQIPVEQFHYYDVNKKAYVVEPGAYDLEVGASSGDIRKTVSLTVGK